MGFILTPIKFVIFAFAVFGFLQIKVGDKSLFNHLNSFFNSETEMVLDSEEGPTKKPLVSTLISDETLEELDDVTQGMKQELQKSLTTLKEVTPDLIPLHPPPSEMLNKSQEKNIARAPRKKVFPGTLIPKELMNPKRLKKPFSDTLDSRIQSKELSNQDRQELNDLLDVLP